MKFYLLFAAILLSISQGARADYPVGEAAAMMRLLPENTETVAVGRGSMTIEASKPQGRWEPKWKFAGDGPFFNATNVWMTIPCSRLVGRTVEFSLEGRRAFRSPTSFGLEIYDGCGFLRLRALEAENRPDLIKRLGLGATKTFITQGRTVSVFQGEETKSDRDYFRIYAAVPKDDLVLLTTSRELLEQVLKRIVSEKPALPAPKQTLLAPNWPGWQAVDTASRYWGVRFLSPKVSAKFARQFGGISGITQFEDSTGGTLCIRFLGGKHTGEINSLRQAITTETGMPVQLKFLAGYAELTLDLKETAYDPRRVQFFIQGLLGPAIFV